HRSEPHRERRSGDAQQRYAGDPRKVNALGRPDNPRMERVKAMRDRVRPPLETPDEDLRVEPIARVDLRHSQNQVAAVKQNRQRQVGEERANRPRQLGAPDSHAARDRPRIVSFRRAQFPSCGAAVQSPRTPQSRSRQLRSQIASFHYTDAERSVDPIAEDFFNTLLRHSRYDLAELGFAEGAMGLGAHVAFAFHSERKLRHDLVRRGLHNQEGIVLTHQVIEGLHLRALGVESLPDRLESFGRGLHVLDTLMRVAGQNHECCHSCLPPKQGSSQTVTDRGCLRTLRWSRPARTVAVSQNLIRLGSRPDPEITRFVTTGWWMTQSDANCSLNQIP